MLQWNGIIFGPYSGMVETVHFETMGCKFHKQKWLYTISRSCPENRIRYETAAFPKDACQYYTILWHVLKALVGLMLLKHFSCFLTALNPKNSDQIDI